MRKATIIEEALGTVARTYPKSQMRLQIEDITRIAFNIELLFSRLKSGTAGCHVLDVGGGIGLFAPGCVSLGLRAIVADDFLDHGEDPVVTDVLSNVHQRLGVEVIARDVVKCGLVLPPDSLDAVTTFDSMEHWHQSPKRLFAQLMAALKPGAPLIISVPNCVNLRKRISVPLGRGKWTSMADWYERDVFRSHVREPDVDDLRYIARDLGLEDVEIIGRNWCGLSSTSVTIRTATRLADPALRLFPSLCADLYLVGSKATATTA